MRAYPAKPAEPTVQRANKQIRSSFEGGFFVLMNSSRFLASKLVNSFLPIALPKLVEPFRQPLLLKKDLMIHFSPKTTYLSFR